MEYIENIRNKVLQNLKNITQPGDVLFSEKTPQRLRMDELYEVNEDLRDPELRISEKERDSRIAKDEEMSDSEEDDDEKPRRNKHSSNKTPIQPSNKTSLQPSNKTPIQPVNTQQPPKPSLPTPNTLNNETTNNKEQDTVNPKMDTSNNWEQGKQDDTEQILFTFSHSLLLLIKNKNQTNLFLKSHC